jgi:hypothetical protein
MRSCVTTATLISLFVVLLGAMLLTLFFLALIAVLLALMGGAI